MIYTFGCFVCLFGLFGWFVCLFQHLCILFDIKSSCLDGEWCALFGRRDAQTHGRARDTKFILADNASVEIGDGAAHANRKHAHTETEKKKTHAPVHAC